jgi:hypothetical protein
MSRYVLFLVLAAGALGCGQDRYAPVRGRVLLDGQPLADAYVTFQPVGGTNHPNPGPGSYGKTDADGRFTLRVVGENRPGAVSGSHSVAISAYRGAPPDPESDSARGPVNFIPPRYNNETTLIFEVPRGGSESADFELAKE